MVICHEQREGVPTNYIGTVLTIGFGATTAPKSPFTTTLKGL
jgi:hypothetical protein